MKPIYVIASQDRIEILKRREEFAKKYCHERGWDFEDLTIGQVLEIRKQPQWQNPHTENNEA